MFFITGNMTLVQLQAVLRIIYAHENVIGIDIVILLGLLLNNFSFLFSFFISCFNASFLQNMFQFIKFFLLSRPTCYESADDFIIVLSFPDFECNTLGKGIIEGRREHDKLLIGRRIVGDCNAMLLEDAADASSHGDSVSGYLEVKLISK